MDILIPEIQMMIYSYVHKIQMNEVIRELPEYMNKVNVKRCEIYKDCILSMMGDPHKKKQPTFANEKIATEIWKQSMIDEGYENVHLI